MESVEGDAEMRKLNIIIALALIAAPATVQAEGLLDWLPKASSSSAKEKPTDSAKLLTIEPGESEMYPQVSQEGRHLIVTVKQKKKGAISRRAIENGDPLNVVTNDARAMDSARWYENSVTFLSQRAGSLGMWKKAADGEGVVRRVKELQGQITQPLLLKDGSVIAVRFEAAGKTRAKLKANRDGFNNWQVTGYRSEVVLIDQHGSVRVLSQGTNPSLSPDGEWIVFTMPVGRSYHLYMMRVDGSELTQLTDERSVDVQPTWSRDGKWIVFTSNRAKADMRKPKNSNWDIWAIDREGRNLTQITMDEARDGAPAVGKDGRVYFHADRKISKTEKALRNFKGRTGKFHIWSIKFPEGSMPK